MTLGMRTGRVGALRLARVVLVSLLLVGCQNAGSFSGPGAGAVWRVSAVDSLRLQRSSTAFWVQVLRVSCNSGVTGDVRPPDIQFRDTEVVVTFTVTPPPADVATCQANDWVPYKVRLNESVGDRQLVDGQCLAGGEAADSSWCSAPTRWRS